MISALNKSTNDGNNVFTGMYLSIIQYLNIVLSTVFRYLSTILSAVLSVQVNSVCIV